MTAPPSRRRVGRIALATSAALALAAARPSGWESVERLRAALAADAPLVASFEQTFVPAGFEGGDTERGEVALSLPDCLRWDYRDPVDKSFLICGDRAWSWVAGEPRGRRISIDAESELGLDLLLLPVEALAARYRLTAASGAPGEELRLAPLAADRGAVEVTLDPDAAGTRLERLEWRDEEGNLTRFRFAGWSRLDDAERFAPPADLDWTDPGDDATVR